MEQHLTPGVLVEHAGRSWRVHKPLGPDAVLLRNDAGEIVSVDPIRVTKPRVSGSAVLEKPVERRPATDTDRAEAARRRDRLARLMALPSRSSRDVEDAAAELGLRPRRVWALLRQAEAAGGDVAAFLPRRSLTRATRLQPSVEALIAHAVRNFYAQRGRPSLSALHREIAGRCRGADLPPPSYRAVQARVVKADPAWLARRRAGAEAARPLRLLTGAHPGADAPWQRVQIDSTPCDVIVVSETDRQVVGRPTATFALDLYSRVILGFSVSLEAASTLTVATCLAHGCLPKDEWLTQRDLGFVRWPVYGRPATLEYDQGPENEARGIQRGLQRHGIQGKARAKGRPEQHGHIERVIGTMMRKVHELRGATFSGPRERGPDPAERACLTLTELERILALSIDSYHHATHAGIGERPMDRDLAWYRQPGLADGARVPPRLPADRLLLDFLPYERRALTRSGVRLFRVDYSSADLQPLWSQDRGRKIPRIVVYDPRSLAQVWVLDEAAGSYVTVPTRSPRPDLTLAESLEARGALRVSVLRDRTEERLFDNLERVRAIETAAKTATARRKAERAVQARRASDTVGVRTEPDPHQSAANAASWPASEIVPFSDVEFG